MNETITLIIYASVGFIILMVGLWYASENDDNEAEVFVRIGACAVLWPIIMPLTLLAGGLVWIFDLMKSIRKSRKEK